MKRLRASSLWRDTSGAIAPLVAVMAVVLIASAALALDFGTYYVGNRNLRAATEAAALSAAVYPDNADARARASLAKNGYPDGSLKTFQVEIGRYCADSTPGAVRFSSVAASACPGNKLSTAVRLHTSATSRQYFAGILGTHSPIPAMAATATAARIDEAGIGMSTGILGVSGLTGSVVSLVNAVLSTLTGDPKIKLDLTPAHLSALLGTNVDAAKFFHALAAGDESITYGQIATSTYSLTKLLNAASDATVGTPDANLGSAITALSAAGNVQIPLEGLFDLGVWEKMPVGDANEPQNLKAGLNVYQLISYGLQARNHGLNITIPESLLGGGSGTLAEIKLAEGWSGPVGRARFAFGPQGETSAVTSALRVQLKVKVGNLGGVLPAIANVPLLLDVGSGAASITSINCDQQINPADFTQVKVKLDSQLLGAYLGEFTTDPMSLPFKDLDPDHKLGPATLLGIVKLQAAVKPVTGGSDTITFNQTGSGPTIGHPPSSGQSAMLGNSAQLAQTVSSLGSKLTVQVCLPNILGIVICVNLGPVVDTVTTLVSNVLTLLGVDPLLNGLLQALGLQLGYANVWVTGARCGVPVLV